jgi:hypothetical protein
MKTRFIVPALLLAATFITPASANWFSNPYQGVNRYIGSTPNPKPEDVRENRTIVVTQNGDANSDQAQAKKPRAIEAFLNELFAPKAKKQEVAQTH